MNLPATHPRPVLRVGIGGPVGSGKTALMDALCKQLRSRYVATTSPQRSALRGTRDPRATLARDLLALGDVDDVDRCDGSGRAGLPPSRKG